MAGPSASGDEAGYAPVRGTRPEHAVELFRLRGGGRFGDLAGLPAAQLAVLPGTSHLGMLERADWLVPMVNAFLDANAS